MVAARSPYNCLHSLESTGQQALVTLLKSRLAHPVTTVGPSAGGIEVILPQEGGNHLCFPLSQDFKDSHPCFFQENKDLSCFACKPERGQNLDCHLSIFWSGLVGEFSPLYFFRLKNIKEKTQMSLELSRNQFIGSVSTSQLSRAFCVVIN